MFCPNCGSPVSPTAKFCGNCGHALDSASSDSGDGGASAAAGASFEDPTRRVPQPQFQSQSQPQPTQASGPAPTPEPDPESDPEPSGRPQGVVIGIVIACVVGAIAIGLIGWWFFAGAGSPAAEDAQAEVAAEEEAAETTEDADGQPEGEAAGESSDDAADQAEGDAAASADQQAADQADAASQEPVSEESQVWDSLQGWWSTMDNVGGLGQFQFAGNEVYEYYFSGGTGDSYKEGPYPVEISKSSDGPFWYVDVNFGRTSTTYMYYPDDPNVLYFGTEAGPQTEGRLERADGPNKNFEGLY